MYVITDEHVQSIINCIETVKENMDVNNNIIEADDVILGQSIKTLQQIVDDYEHQQKFYTG
jgi:hypothetical protein